MFVVAWVCSAGWKVVFDFLPDSLFIRLLPCYCIICIHPLFLHLCRFRAWYCVILWGLSNNLWEIVFFILVERGALFLLFILFFYLETNYYTGKYFNFTLYILSELYMWQPYFGGYFEYKFLLFFHVSSLRQTCFVRNRKVV